MKNVVIYGPPASGKTRNAERLRSAYQCVGVCDWDRHQDRKPPRGYLVLTTASLDEIEHRFPDADHVSIDDALKLIGGAV